MPSVPNALLLDYMSCLGLPIGELFAPMEKYMQGLLAGYSRDELKTLLDFAERAGGFMLVRVAELNDGK